MRTGLWRTTAILLTLSIIPVITSEAAPRPASPSGCCNGLRGNVDGKGIIDLADLAALISYLTGAGFVPSCQDEANVDGQGIVDLADLDRLIAYFVGAQPSLPPCPTDTSFISDTVRIATLHAVHEEITSIASLPVDSFNQRLLTYLQGRPEFAASGISAEAGNVWARFNDGVLLLISNAFGQSLDTLPGDPLPPDSSGGAPKFLPQRVGQEASRLMARKALAGSGDDLPASVGFRVLSALGDAYPAVSTTVSRLKSWLKTEHYLEMSPLVSVFQLRTVGGDGLFCYFGHGGAGQAISGDSIVPEYGIWTSNSSESTDSIAQFSADFKAGRLCYFEAPSSVDTVNKTVVFAERIGITSKFISYYWQPFAQNALVVINACGSDSVPAFRNAIISKGGPAYFGWSRSVSSKGACYATEYLFDRLLGANKAYPRENPLQRPFAAGAVYTDMQNRGLQVQPGGDGVKATSSTLRYHPGNSNFGLLAPSIEQIFVDDNFETMSIFGDFGEDPGTDGQVTVNGVARNIQVWTSQFIQCDIANFGPGSVGPVQVGKRGDYGGLTPLTFRESNVVNLTEWQGQMRYTRNEIGSLAMAATFDLHFRADVHTYRDVPGGPLIAPTFRQCYQMQDAQATISVSGSYQFCAAGACDLFEWFGSTPIPLFDVNNVGNHSQFEFIGDFQLSDSQLFLGENLEVLSGLTERTTVDGPGQHYVLYDTLTMQDVKDSGLYDNNDSNQFIMDFQPGFALPAGVRIFITHNLFRGIDATSTATLRMEWDAMTPNYPSDPEDGV